MFSAADKQSRLVWMDALQFNGRVVSAPWQSDQIPRNMHDTATEAAKTAQVVVDLGRTARLSGGPSAASDAGHTLKKKPVDTDLAVGLANSGDLASEEQVQATRIADENVGQDSATGVLTKVDSSMNRDASADSFSTECYRLDQPIDPKKIEALREMVGSKLRRICTDMMKAASKKPSGPDPSAAALVLGQNFLCVRLPHQLLLCFY